MVCSFPSEWSAGKCDSLPIPSNECFHQFCLGLSEVQHFLPEFFYSCPHLLNEFINKSAGIIIIIYFLFRWPLTQAACIISFLYYFFFFGLLPPKGEGREKNRPRADDGERFDEPNELDLKRPWSKLPLPPPPLLRLVLSLGSSELDFWNDK